MSELGMAGRVGEEELFGFFGLEVIGGAIAT
jgi:hypothetical protein